jgi:octanoyl-[GcvH]:protein N-octanoyltransferase
MQDFARALSPRAKIEIGAGQCAIARDEKLLDDILNGIEDQETIRLWTNSKCLVTTKALSRRAHFAAACTASERAGWPVHIRSSGGTTVVHRPGILNVSRFRTWRGDTVDLDRAYRFITDPLIVALKRLGIDADVGPVPDSYCDGRYNIRVDGKKLVGTACQIKRRSGRIALLAHGAMVIDGDMGEDLAAVTRFEQMLDLPRVYYVTSHHSFAQCLKG